MHMKAIIVEDEVIAAQALQSLIGELYPDIEVIAILQSIEESVEWFQAHPMPDLAFMDIHLADGPSFDIFEEVNVTCPVIFTTAYDEYALKAFEVNSIDYLLKPISKNDLNRSINKYKNLSGTPPVADSSVLKDLVMGLKYSSRAYKLHFLVPERDKLIPLASSYISYIYIDSKNVKAVTAENRTYCLDHTLDELMAMLDPARFFRANRQYIIAHDAVKDLSVWFGGKLSVNLKLQTPERILVSKSRVREFKEWFGNSF